MPRPTSAAPSGRRPVARTRPRALERAKQRVAQLTAELEDRTRELDDAREQVVRVTAMDQLTGLANRACFTERLDTLIGDKLISGRSFALLIVNLDHFRKINETLGQEAGDALLQHVAMRLFFCAADADLVARLGGDEFAVLIRTNEGRTSVESLAGELLQAVREPLVYRDWTLETSCSIGIARFPDDSTKADELQRHADLALDRSKLIGPAFTVYEPEMGREYAARQQLGAELAVAIRTGQIEAWFQPIYDHASGQVVSAEALARWRHPTRGLLTPGQFLHLAEERGLMHELFACMLRSAAPVIRRRVGRGALRSVSVNVSPSQFSGRNVAFDILALLRELELPPEALTIEVTEEVLVKDFTWASAQVEQLASQGVRIALDDFGVGYSNINYLRQFAFHTLKVDRSLIIDVATEPKIRSILGAIVGLAQALNLNLVAEGVETEAQSTQLARLGIRQQQGYLHGRPMPGVAFEQAITGSLCRSAIGAVSVRPEHVTEAVTAQ